MKANPAYGKALSALREAHRDEFETALREVTAETGKPRHSVHSQALSRLRQRRQDEYWALVGQFTVVWKRPVSLVKHVPMRELRTDMDPTDALILFERGMTLKQMAEHDGCSQRAALKALLPQLLERQPRNRAWFERSSRPPSSRELAEMLGTSGQFVAQMTQVA